MKCTACETDKAAVFRTNPLGQSDAGWMCQPCIVKHHDASLIDPETQELANILTESTHEKANLR
jgi:hypothetical protein